MLKYCVAIFVAFALTACGGGGGVSSSFSAVSVLSDGSGVARIAGGSSTLVLITEVDAYIAQGNAGLTGTSDGNLKLDQVPIIGSTNVATIRQGAVTDKGGTSQNITVYEINNATEGFALIEVPQYDVVYLLQEVINHYLIFLLDRLHTPETKSSGIGKVEASKNSVMLPLMQTSQIKNLSIRVTQQIRV